MLLRELLKLSEAKVDAPKTIGDALKAVLAGLDYDIDDVEDVRDEDQIDIFTSRATKLIKTKLNKALAPFGKAVYFQDRDSGTITFSIHSIEEVKNQEKAEAATRAKWLTGKT
jgi:hypothetical protein